jgi:hypothetical protein
MELVAIGCAPGNTSSGVNSTLGLPGAQRMTMNLAVETFCPDLATPFELGGSNCP